MTDNNLSCKKCKKKFSNTSNLRAHVKRFHPQKMEELAPRKTFNCYATCNECSKTFSNATNLKRHIKNIHNDKKDMLLPALKQRNLSKKCPLCEHEDITRTQLIHHFKSAHNLPIESEIITFSSRKEFCYWKEDLEKATNSLFISKHGTRKILDLHKTVFTCHRSGIYRPKGRGIRQLKIKGTNKINGYCPAELNVTYLENGKCKVIFTKTHVGHDGDLNHVILTASERTEIATKIAAQIPFSAILDEVRSSANNCKLERKHLLTRKDLYNIEQSFRLNSNSVRRKSEKLSAERDDANLLTIDYVEQAEYVDVLEAEKQKIKESFLQLLDNISSLKELEDLKNLLLVALRNQTCEKSADPCSESATTSPNKLRNAFKTANCDKEVTTNDISLLEEENVEVEEIIIRVLDCDDQETYISM